MLFKHVFAEIKRHDFCARNSFSLGNFFKVPRGICLTVCPWTAGHSFHLSPSPYYSNIIRTLLTAGLELDFSNFNIIIIIFIYKAFIFPLPRLPGIILFNNLIFLSMESLWNWIFQTLLLLLFFLYIKFSIFHFQDFQE